MTDLQKEARIGTTIVNKLFDLSGEIYRTDNGGVYVFLKNGDKAAWPWPQVIIRNPRLESKYPRPVKHPRIEFNSQCHCPKGAVFARVRRFDSYRGKVVQIIVYCSSCRKRIGTESYPKRISQASSLYHRRLEKIQAKGSRLTRSQKRRAGIIRKTRSKRGRAAGSIKALKAGRRSKAKR